MNTFIDSGSGNYRVPNVNGKHQIELSDDSFNVWRDYIYKNCGIYFRENKKYLLEGRLKKRINYLGLESYEEYLDFVKKDLTGIKEKKFLYEAITINETYFFRNQPQLDALVKYIIPEILKNHKSMGGNLRIWSAGCSSGEEPYSIAMLISEFIKPKYPSINYEIIGTDIDDSVLSKAKSAEYQEYSLRETTPYFRRKYFTQINKHYKLDKNIYKMVKFQNLNLSESLSIRRMTNYDIIICANVLIYFDQQSKTRVISSFYNSINPEGYLLIGYSESLHGISRSFKPVNYPKTIAYKRG